MAGSSGKTRILVDTAALGDGDSIAAYLTDAAGTLLTSTLVGADQSLDVNVTASVLPTGAATETTLASLLTELQGLSHAEDAAHTSGDLGVQILAVRNDTPGSLVSADGDYAPLQVDSTGALRVNAAVTIGDNKAEDSAHSSGDTGSFMLSVRNDDQATTFTSATGDYNPIATDAKGAVFTKNVANGSHLSQRVQVGTTATQLPAANLASRTSMFVQMLSTGQLYLGDSNVTTSGANRGFQLGNGGFVSLDVGPDIDVYGVASSANRDVIVWEFA